MATDVKPVHLSKTYAGMLVTLFPNITIIPSPDVPALLNTLLLDEKLFTSIAFQFISVKLVHPSKAETPMLITPFPMVTDIKPLQPSKARPPMLVTLLGMVMDVKPVQP